VGTVCEARLSVTGAACLTRSSVCRYLADIRFNINIRHVLPPNQPCLPPEYVARASAAATAAAGTAPVSDTAAAAPAEATAGAKRKAVDPL